MELEPQEVISKHCAHKPCRAEFETTDLAQKYCSPAHGKMARRRNSRASKRYTQAVIERPAQLCLTPYKKVYVTQQLATEAANALGGDAEGIRPYRCHCGALHIGHRTR